MIPTSAGGSSPVTVRIDKPSQASYYNDISFTDRGSARDTPFTT